jgi:hypothetical protein
MSMTKYGATPEQRSKTAQGNPGTSDIKHKTESLKEKLAREKKKKDNS